MFETMNSDEITMQPMFLAYGARRWDSVNLVIKTQWFFVEYRTKNKDESELLDYKFLANTKQISEMLLIDHYQIVNVYLGSPDYINGSDSWKMEKIKEIWEASLKNDELDPRGRIYVLADGREYVHSYVTMDKNDFTKKELLFDSKTLIDFKN